MLAVRLVRRFSLAAFCVAVSAVAARAADVLTHVPDSALAVVVVNNLTAAGEKVDAMAKTLSLDQPGGLDRALEEAGIEEGINRNGSAALIVVVKEDSDEPGAIALLPVSDYKVFIAQLSPDDADAKIAKVELANKEMAVTKVGDYAALVPAADDGLLEQVTTISKSVADTSKGSAAWLKQQDVYALRTSSGIALASDKIIAAIAGAKEEIPGLDENQAEMLALAFGMWENVFKTMRRDVSQIVLGVRSGDGGLHIASRTTFKPDAKAAEIAGKIPAPKESLLAGLPDGKYVLAGGGTVSPELMGAFYEWSADFMRNLPGEGKASEEDIDEMVKLSADSLKGVKSFAFGMLSGKTDEPLYSHLVGVMKVDDAAKFMANYKKALEKMNDLAEKNEESVFFQKSTTKETTIAGKPGMEITMNLSDKFAPKDPVSGMIFERLFGDVEKIKVYLGAADKNSIVAGYINQANVEKAIKAVASGAASSNADFRKTADMLPKGSQLVGFLSLRELFQMVIGLAPPEAGAMLGPLADFPETPAIGFGAKLSAEGVETDFVVPDETLEGIGEVIASFGAASAKR